MFKEIDQKQSVDVREKEVQKFWEENNIFAKSINARNKKDTYTFFDGPPFATGLPHYGHIVGQTMKDVVPRYWTMRGKRIERKWGWDCHGLPIENIVEKELGSTSKKDIEAMGVAKFNEICRSKVLEYVSEWEKVIPRIGRWADMDNAYRTMDRNYMESVWWVFAELYRKDLIYKSYRSMHICPRCETTLSQSEVSEGYKDVKDLSVIAKFKLKQKVDGKTQKIAGEEVGKNTSILAWTTTPWTLPSNVALAIGEDIEYVKVAQNSEIKKVFLISGKHACASDSYYPKLKNDLEKNGFDVTVVDHIDSSNPYLEKNLQALTKYDFDNSHVVVHSLGSSTFLKFLENADIGIASLTMLAPTYPGKSFSSTNVEWIKNSGYVGFEIDFDVVRKKIKTKPNLIYSNESIIKKEDFIELRKVLDAHAYYEDGKEHFFSKEYNNEPNFAINFQSYFICAKDLVKEVFEGKEHEIVQKIKGSDLIGLSYEPIYSAYAQAESLENRDNGWKVYGADFVTTEAGTGIVHIAPAFGEDDMALGKERDLPFVQHVGMDGIVNAEVGAPLAGADLKPRAKGKSDDVREIDITVVRDLAGRGLLFGKEKYTHSYPHCWRCDTALLNYATSSWFVAVTKIKEKLLETAQNINWSPAHIKEGRFGKWLEGARDWSISRQRFWASVIPIWICDNCESKKVFGSVAELEEVSGQKIDDLHKHIVDEVIFDCAKCSNGDDSGGTMRRVPDVLDTWFDSGAMPYAQMHYPFENKQKFEAGFPADFIAEGQDQTRAWFYYLHVFAGALFDQNAFDNVIVNGIVLAEDGKKMSKKLQNYPDPMEIVAKYGADTLRMYLVSSPIVAADNLSFSEKDMSELSRGLFRMLRQSYSFFVMYANVDEWTLQEKGEESEKKNILDQWIMARLQELIVEVNTQMEAYNLQKATRAFAPFVDDLSNWYIRRSRRRFWKSEDDSDKDSAYITLYFVLVELAKTIAPFAPFIAEEIYRNLTNCHSREGGNPDGYAKESVHLEDFPQVAQNKVDEMVIAQMANARDIITQGLELRADNGIKVRQPLIELLIAQREVVADVVDIIKDELNVKNIKFYANSSSSESGGIVVWSDDKLVGLNLEITPELKLEGQAREIIRHIQSARKRADFKVDDRIVLGYEGMEAVFADEDLRNLIAHEVLAIEVVNGAISNAEFSQEVGIDDAQLQIFLKKV